MHFKCENCDNNMKVTETKEKGVAADVPFFVKVVSCKVKGNVKIKFPGAMNSCRNFRMKYDYVLDMEKWEWSKKGGGIIE